MAPAIEDAATDPATFWESRYLTHRGESGRVWSGSVNAAVEREVVDLAAGSALDLGCGEGGDALWLAARGWSVTAVDISASALAVGAARALQEGLADRIDWVRADLAAWQPMMRYDLVTAAFLHSPVELPRERILRRAAAAVGRGGRLLVVGHGGPPRSGSGEHDQNALPLPTPDEVLASLHLDDGWVVETNDLVDRHAIRPDGTAHPVIDTVLRVRRDR
ncbi:SAM-dependent methyltransferase [Planctomonas psychrotolerans]|uniref:SAM-dependent methyltransferase n=1 Tax=Planctomonas psychrotolerans TaxID=2528712 RepID=UPI0012389476|nr:class I SAM-dependent methyltransferase [Planctomonas psychrotolerans]